MCVGTEATTNQPQNLLPEEREDTDPSWRTPESTIVPIVKDKFTVKPAVITFDAFSTLIEPSQSVGRWYREVLNNACDMKIRLPRPALFTAAFNKAFADQSAKVPNYGVDAGMSSRDWWFEVVKQTYKGTANLNQIDEEELEAILPEVFDELYDTVFSTSEGWLVKENVEYTLSKLVAWRDQGGGPKVGVLSNFDERLDGILQGLGLASSFDFTVNSRDAKSRKPDRGIFDVALKAAGVSDCKLAFHVGDSLKTDVAGALAAGWTPLRINEWFDEDLPDWTAIESEDEAEAGALKRQAIMSWGRRDTATGLEWHELWGLDDILTLFGFPEDPDKLLRSTYIRNFREDF
jgi:REG-2-like HAD superfamily hydrolase